MQVWHHVEVLKHSSCWQRRFFQCPKWFNRTSFDFANIVRPTPFYPLFLQGNAGHNEGHLRHDGEMHVPHPQRGDSAPARWSVLPGKWATCSQHSGANLESLLLNALFSLWQKMDKNKDGVVTIDEFIDCCQNVSWTFLHISFSSFSPDLIFCFVGCAQDENIMRSMHLFENVL